MAGAGKQMRGRPLVDKVLRATIAEMARVGLEHLAIEEVAARANVNKTTIYRRWATADDLARAALTFASEADLAVPDTGSLRGDLHAFAREFGRVLAHSDVPTMMRMRWGGDGRGPLAKLMREIQRKKHSRWKVMLHRATKRGELRKNADADLIYDVVVGALLYLTVLGPTRRSLDHLNRAIDVILDGALKRTAP
jgi:AcrR family transcriptional regulator